MIQTIEFTMPELLKRVDSGEIPMSAKVRVVYDDTALSPREESDPVLALLQARLKVAEGATPEEIAVADGEWEKFKQGMNDTRRENGEEAAYRP